MPQTKEQQLLSLPDELPSNSPSNSNHITNPVTCHNFIGRPIRAASIGFNGVQGAAQDFDFRRLEQGLVQMIWRSGGRRAGRGIRPSIWRSSLKANSLVQLLMNVGQHLFAASMRSETGLGASKTACPHRPEPWRVIGGATQHDTIKILHFVHG